MKCSVVDHLKSLALPLALLLAASGCSNNDPQSSQQFGSSADRAAIEKVVQDDEVFDTQSINDDGPQLRSYEDGLPKTTEQIDAVRFGRLGRYKLESVDVEFTTDTTAIATIVHSLNGKFLILATNATDPNAIGTLYSKDMTNTIVRKAKLRKVRNTGVDRRDWRVVAVSGAVASSPTTTLTINELTIQTSDTSKLTVTDPLAYFFSRDSLREYHRGDSVKVFLKLTNTNDFPPPPGETVLVRHGMDHHFHRTRTPLHDDGLYPDVAAGDGIYSGAFRLGFRHGVFHGGVDIIDNGTIYDDVAPYNSVVWALPYFVRF